MDIAAIVGFDAVAGEEGRALLWLFCLLPNSFFKTHRFPITKAEFRINRCTRLSGSQNLN